MSDKTALGDRIKANYESRTRYKLTRRIPVIIRLDGVCFSTYTKGLDKPFDNGLIDDMEATTRFLCENIMGAKCGYTQSDEISILITDNDKLETQAWYDYNLQKMASVAASMATAKFNQLRLQRDIKIYSDKEGYESFVDSFPIPKLAFFDARVFQISEPEEIVNCFLWRQRDAERNSISGLAQSLYSHTELHKKNVSEMNELCFQKGQNWNDLPFFQKRGSFIIKQKYINDIRVKMDDGEQEPEIGEVWFQENNKDGLFPSELGRLLIWEERVDGQGLDWCDTEIKKIRNKWENVTTPIFGKNRESILDLLEK